MRSSNERANSRPRTPRQSANERQKTRRKKETGGEMIRWLKAADEPRASGREEEGMRERDARGREGAG